MKFKKKPVVVDAHQWWHNGDHPDDQCTDIFPSDGEPPFKSEGQIVRYYRSPRMNGQIPCRHCTIIMHEHGWIDTLEGGHIVCPGDWIITGIRGEHWPVKPDIFASTYEST